MQECGSGTQRRHSLDPRRHVSNSIPVAKFLNSWTARMIPARRLSSPPPPPFHLFRNSSLNFSISPPLFSFPLLVPLLSLVISLSLSCSRSCYLPSLLASAHSRFPREWAKMRREILCIDRSACATPPPALRWRVKYSDEIRCPSPLHRNLNFVYRVISACIVERIIHVIRYFDDVYHHFYPYISVSRFFFDFYSFLFNLF